MSVQGVGCRVCRETSFSSSATDRAACSSPGDMCCPVSLVYEGPGVRGQGKGSGFACCPVSVVNEGSGVRGWGYTSPWNPGLEFDLPCEGRLTTPSTLPGNTRMLVHEFSLRAPPPLADCTPPHLPTTTVCAWSLLPLSLPPSPSLSLFNDISLFANEWYIFSVVCCPVSLRQGGGVRF